jgi:histidinol-phosphate phosphatase family protein
VKQAVILAGGKGTRLQSVLGGLPKPLADVGGVPLLAHQLRLLQVHGFDEAVLLVSHRADAIQEWLDTEAVAPGFRVRLIDDQPPRGTGGAILNVLSGLAEVFAVLYGDTMLDVDLDRFWAWHAAEPATAVSLFLHPNDHPHDSDLVEVDEEGEILGFHPYPHPDGVWLPNLVNAALYIVRRDALLPWRELTGSLDVAKDLFPRMLQAKQRLRGYVSPEYIKDAGTPSRLEKVRKAYADGTIARSSLQAPQRAVFLDRDGTLNEADGYIRSAQQLQVYPDAGRAVRRLNDAEWRTVVVTNQPVIARGEVTTTELRQIHARLDTELARDGGFIDRLYYCPHHPDGGYAGEVAALKIACDCRKPADGLIRRAQTDLNIDLTASWMIGDSSADLGAAEAAGVQSILVETGEAGMDARHPFEAGIVVPDVSAAVDFILDVYPRLSASLTGLAGRIGPGEDWFIGGLSRAGKSTLAAVLQCKLRRQGRRCEVVQLDRWILGLDERGAGVFGRFDMAALEQVVLDVGKRAVEPAALTMPAYSRSERRRLPGTLTRTFDADTTILWEGIVAVELARRAGALARSIHVETSEADRRERVLAHYVSRGIPEAGPSALAERETDEHVPIRALGAIAAVRISLDSQMRTPAMEQKAATP